MVDMFVIVGNSDEVMEVCISKKIADKRCEKYNDNGESCYVVILPFKSNGS